MLCIIPVTVIHLIKVCHPIRLPIVSKLKAKTFKMANSLKEIRRQANLLFTNIISMTKITCSYMYNFSICCPQNLIPWILILINIFFLLYIPIHNTIAYLNLLSHSRGLQWQTDQTLVTMSLLYIHYQGAKSWFIPCT